MAKNIFLAEALGSKPGALHHQLGIPKEKRIPTTLLKEIMTAEPGKVIKNPTRTGKKRYRVTPLLRKRANPVLTARRFRHGSRKPPRDLS
jgi:hypothetical protein